MKISNAVKVIQVLVIPVLTSFVHTEHWVFAPFHLDFDAISGSLDSCTINSCQQVQNDVQVLSDTRQQGQSLSWQRKPVSFPVLLESQCTKAWDKLRFFYMSPFQNNLKVGTSVLILLLLCAACVTECWSYKTHCRAFEKEVNVLHVDPAAEGLKRQPEALV